MPDAVASQTTLELIEPARPGGDERERLIMLHAPLVRAIARRYAGRGMSYDDLVQTGYLGLIQAVDRFDPSRGVPLRAYAARTIDGEVMHLFRDRGWAVHVPRSLQELGRRVKTTTDKLSHSLGRNPTIEEVAEAMGEDPDQITAGTHALRAYAAEPLVDRSADDDADVRRSDRALEVAEPGFERALDRETLRRAMRGLTGRERQIVALRFFHDRTQSEIAERLGISQMHVSRLLRKALAQMREGLDPLVA
jgi:RNA polymerase sigma-B factor